MPIFEWRTSERALILCYHYPTTPRCAFQTECSSRPINYYKKKIPPETCRRQLNMRPTDVVCKCVVVMSLYMSYDKAATNHTREASKHTLNTFGTYELEYYNV